LADSDSTSHHSAWLSAFTTCGGCADLLRVADVSVLTDAILLKAFGVFATGAFGTASGFADILWVAGVSVLTDALLLKALGVFAAGAFGTASWVTNTYATFGSGSESTSTHVTEKVFPTLIFYPTTFA